MWKAAFATVQGRLPIRPDGRLLAAGSIDLSLKVWDVATGRELTTLPNNNELTSIVFLPGRDVIAANTGNGSVELWDVVSGQQVSQPLSCSQRPQPSIAVNEQDLILLCVDWQAAVIYRWELRDFRPLSDLKGPFSGLGPMSQLAADGTLVTTDVADGHVQLLNVRTGGVVGYLPVGRSGAIEFTAVRKGRVATVDLAGGSLTLWNWEGAGEVHDGRIVAKNLHAVAFSPDGNKIAFATEAGDVAIMDNANPKALKIFGSYANRIENAGMTPNGSVLAVQVWYDSHFDIDLKSGSLIKAGRHSPTATGRISLRMASSRGDGFRLKRLPIGWRLRRLTDTQQPWL